MSAPVKRATLADLARTEGRAELIAGRVVKLPLFGVKPGHIVGEIAVSLHAYAEMVRKGEVGTATLAYVVPKLHSGRESFSPAVSWYVGPLPANPMSFIEGPPTFAVEVRCAGEFGNAANAEYAAKRNDYFQAGPLVVWDVDPQAETITSYRYDNRSPGIFRRGDVADAEPAVPGWQISVDDVFA